MMWDPDLSAEVSVQKSGDRRISISDWPYKYVCLGRCRYTVHESAEVFI